MNPLDTALSALTSLWANKLRSGLTVLGIVIGVAAVISLMSIGRGAQTSITEDIRALGTNLLFVQPGSGGDELGFWRPDAASTSTLTLEDAYALADSPSASSVASVAPEIRSFGQLVYGRKNAYGEVLGVTPEYLTVRDLELSTGGFISAGHVANRLNVAVLGSSVSENLFGLRDPVGQTVKINGRPFTVIGVLDSEGGGPFGLFDNQVLAPITTAYYRLASERTTQGEIAVNLINVQVKDESLMDQAEREIATLLRLRHRLTGEDDFTINNQQDTLEALEGTTNALTLFLAAIAGISLLVGGIGVMNIMLVSVTERTREIGIRKAMGATRRNILVQFVTESILLSAAGGILGVLTGVAISKLIDVLVLADETFKTVFSGDIVLLALLVSAAIGLFFGIYPAMRAARQHPIDALRYE